MANRRVSARRVKRRWTYNVAEAAAVTNVTAATVRQWLKIGLEPVPGIRPTIIRGADLIAFLKKREIERKRPCGPGRIYCLRCKEPREPAFGGVEYWPDTTSKGTLKGLCSTCGGLLCRRTTLAGARQAAANLAISFKCVDWGLGQTAEAHSNPHFDEGWEPCRNFALKTKL